MSKPQTAEQKVTTSFLAVGAVPRQTFFPNAPEYYIDKLGEQYKSLPDFYKPDDNSGIFFEFKDEGLNRKQSKKACLNKLRIQYNWRFGRSPGSLSHDAISSALWNAGYRLDCLKHAWNHSLAKHLIIQAHLGFERYIIVFSSTPTPDDSLYYRKKGLGYMSRPAWLYTRFKNKSGFSCCHFLSA